MKGVRGLNSPWYCKGIYVESNPKEVRSCPEQAAPLMYTTLSLWLVTVCSLQFQVCSSSSAQSAVSRLWYYLDFVELILFVIQSWLFIHSRLVYSWSNPVAPIIIFVAQKRVVRVRLELTTLMLSARMRYLSKKKMFLWGSNSQLSCYSMTLYWQDHTETAPVPWVTKKHTNI